MRWARYVKYAALILAAAVVVGVVLLPWVLKVKVEREIAKIRAAGDPVSTEELAETIPDEENAAVVYAKAFEIISESPAKDEINAASDLLSAEKRAGNPALWDEAAHVAAKYRRALEIAEEAAERPKCRFPFNWDEGSLHVKFPEFGQLRTLSRLAAISALLAARNGDMDEAVRRIELAYRIGDSVKDEPVLIGQLVRFALLAIASTRLSEALTYGELTEHQARRLYDVLASIDLIPGYVQAMKGERAMGIEGFESFRLAYAWKLFAHLNELHYLRVMNRNVEYAAMSCREAARIGLNLEPDLPWYGRSYEIMYPALSGVGTSRDKYTAALAGDRILLALEAHKHRYGGYPETLDVLRAKLGWEIPEDPFSGEDFVYRREGQGFLLYSIGPDLKDDGGKVKVKGAKGRFNDGNNDIVWEMER